MGSKHVLKAEHSKHLLHHINSQDPNIQFTVEEPAADGSIPFLDTRVTPGPKNTIHTKVYRKPTCTDQYLHWDINHFITAKNSVYNTLAHRATVVSNTPEDLTKELYHLKKALMACQFPKLGPKQAATTISTKTQPQQHQQSNRSSIQQQKQGQQQQQAKLKHLHSHTIHQRTGRKV